MAMNLQSSSRSLTSKETRNSRTTISSWKMVKVWMIPHHHLQMKKRSRSNPRVRRTNRNLPSSPILSSSHLQPQLLQRLPTHSWRKTPMPVPKEKKRSTNSRTHSSLNLASLLSSTPVSLSGISQRIMRDLPLASLHGSKAPRIVNQRPVRKTKMRASLPSKSLPIVTRCSRLK